MSYNGWANYETWSVNLWISNEEGSYHHWRDQTEQAISDARSEHDLDTENEEGELPELTDDARDSAIGTLAVLLEAEYTENAPSLDGVWGDLLTRAIGAVDWHEIAKGMIED